MPDTNPLQSLLAQFLNRPGATRSRQRIVDTGDHAAIYAIGDVHGRLDLLLRLEDAIVADAADRPGRKLIVMLGDYVDRGPSSAQVLDHLMAPPAAGFARVCLAGNHEEMMLDFVRRPSSDADWLAYGGIETLMSYGLDRDEILLGMRSAAGLRRLAAAIPQHHLDFVRGLPGMLTVPGYIFVHAGVRPGVAMEAQRDEDLFWIRHEFIGSEADFGGVVVHGHTPMRSAEITPNRIGIDTGAFATGVLTAAAISGGEVRVVDVRGRGG
jgi:serine/threonine protein phosphatase 1